MARHRSPKAKLVAHGSVLAKRQDEMPRISARPERPDLKPKEGKVYDQVIELLEQHGILETAHGYALERYARMVIEWRHTTDPEIANKLATQLLRLEQHFGMTPLSRNSVNVRPHEGKSKKTKHFKVG